jgi:tripartite-type tricarboxylate transporter receptor subunit TctC
MLKLPDIRSRFIKIGAEARPSTPQELASRIQEETVKWGKVARDAGVKPE